MGWSSGSSLMSEVIVSALKHVPTSCRKKFYKELIEAFEQCDCDTLYECEGIDKLYDAAYASLYPNKED